jgi:uncharacterized protein (UPF0276 family)
MPLHGCDGPAVGIGFRKETHRQTVAALDELDVLEVTADHYVYGTPQVRQAILELSRQVPVVAHGVGLSIGTAVPPDEDYLEQIAEFVEAVGSPWYSEHLAFTKVPGRDVAQLIPLPRTAAMAETVMRNIRVVQKHVPIPLVLENISYYFDYPDADFGETEFLNLVLLETDSLLLLDLENLFINSVNHGFDPYEFLDRVHAPLVRAVHLAGGTSYDDVLVDSHDSPVPDEVFRMLEHLLGRTSPDSVIVERDQHLDAFDELLDDVRTARQVVQRSRLRT